MELLKSKLFRNWSQLFSFGIIAQFLGMIATIRIARVLTPAGYGEFNLIQVYAGIGAVIGGLGLRNVIIRECARHPQYSRQILLKSIFFRIITALLTTAGIYFFVTLYARSLPENYIFFIVLGVAALLSWDTAESIAFGNEWMSGSASINLFGSVIWISAVLLAPHTYFSVVSVMTAFVLLQLSKSALYFIRLKFHIEKPVAQESVASETLIRQSAPFYWLALLTAVSTQIPILFLAERSGQTEVGLYNIGYRLLLPLQLLINTLLSTIYPILSRTFIKEPDRFKRIIRGSFIGISVIGTLGGIVVTLLKTEIVTLLFGSRYENGAQAMALQVWYFLMYAYFCLIGTILGAIDRQKWLAILSTVYAAVVVPLLWYGSSYGASGLAGAFLCAACVNMIYHWIAFRRLASGVLSNTAQLLVFIVPVSGFIISFSVPSTLGLAWRLMACLLFVGASAIVMYRSASIRDLIKKNLSLRIGDMTAGSEQ
jgi:O-antigen/teichoic acid export membrane protein